MRTRLTAAALAAAGLLALTACSSTSSSDSKPTPSATPSVDTSSIQAAAGIPPKPEGAARTTYLAAIRTVDPALVADPDKAISNGRNQCSTLSGSGDVSGHLAAERFGTDAHTLTDKQGQALNAALKTALCH